MHGARCGVVGRLLARVTEAAPRSSSSALSVASVFGLAAMMLTTFIPVARLCSTSTRGVLFAAVSSRTLTWGDYRAADEVELASPRTPPPAPTRSFAMPTGDRTQAGALLFQSDSACRQG